MKTLVYTTCFGKPIYYFLADEMIKSLRSVGYTGDIAVLCDHDFAFSGKAKAYPMDIGDGLWKASLGKAVDPAAYDKILFVDSDVIFTKNPDPLFALEGAHISVEEVPLGWSVINAQFLTDAERVGAMRLELPSVNVGTILLPGKEASVFLAAWEKAWKEAPKEAAPNIWKHTEKDARAMMELWDQAALQAILIRGEMGAKAIPRGLVLMPALKFNHETFSNQTVLIHFCGPLQDEVNKERLFDWMRAAQDLPNLPNLCQQIAHFVQSNSQYNAMEFLMKAYCREKKRSADRLRLIKAAAAL